MSELSRTVKPHSIFGNNVSDAITVNITARTKVVNEYRVARQVLVLAIISI